MKTFISIATLSFFTLISCGQKKEITEDFITLPNHLQEVSGLHYDTTSKTFWTVQDSGNSNELYQIDSTGNIVHTVKIKNQKNKDWEELTSDSEGNLYIGDFGNNKNTRKDLKIIKVEKNNLVKEEVDASAIISFEYPEQKQFPPKDTELIYDAEAFFLYNDNFYIFTKNRSKGFDGRSNVYKIPNVAGHHKAQLVQTFKGCNVYKHCAITGAAISPDQKTFVLLSHSKLWIIDGFNPNAILDGKISEHKLNHVSQKESVSFDGNNTVYIADEVKKQTGGKIYKVDLGALKPKP
ncbi:SdiA-regulated domain-containing protein [Myroides phaeus]|uniref:SdiA-regulated n=1 Tax=Myroides phaeus TaxID=702745 RepID=A0A1G8FY74_9FLAO|nr:SdiA-regulated domain-containing protein [Myroides phaeus]MEC4115381.1 SdiA-regulated domain-containing protein [Myroides phaeus]SDH87037.1 SdiA-regulated [Myroides phaeus]